MTREKRQTAHRLSILKLATKISHESLTDTGIACNDPEYMMNIGYGVLITPSLSSIPSPAVCGAGALSENKNREALCRLLCSLLPLEEKVEIC